MENSFLVSANGTALEVIGKAEILINISGLQIPITARVVRHVSHQLILGADFMRQNHVIIDFQTGILSVGDDLVRAPLHSPYRRQSYLTNINAVCIPAFTEAVIPVKSDRRYDDMAIVTEPLSSFQFKKFAVGRSLSFCNNGRTVCRVANFNPFSLVLTKGTKIASIEDPKVIASCTRVNQAVTPQDLLSMPNQPIDVLEKIATEYGFKINPELTPNQRQELLQILFIYRDVFARSVAEIKRYPHYELDIELMDNRKVFKRNYRLRPEEAETAQKLIQELEDADIIQESTSPDYNSPIFLVRKKNGSSRLVVDLRHVNSLIRPKLIQLPKIDDLMDTITALKRNS